MPSNGSLADAADWCLDHADHAADDVVEGVAEVALLVDLLALRNVLDLQVAIGETVILLTPPLHHY